MTQNRNLSILADQVNSSGVLGVAGGGSGLATTPSNGQLDIGNGTGFTRATLTAGTGITVTNGAGSISIAATGVTSVNTFTGAVQSVLVAGTAQASTSGTSITFTSIPSWVKRITIIFNSVSTNGATSFLAQIGSGSVTTSGYQSTSSLQGFNGAVLSSSSTAGFIIFNNGPSGVFNGHILLTPVSGNTWISSHTLGNYLSSFYSVSGGGSVSLSGALDRVVITTVGGTDTFDAGSINILYE